MKASEFDEKFDNGEDILPYLDLSTLKRHKDQKRVNLDIPVWMIRSLDREATRIGVTRQSLMKMWMADKLASLPQPTYPQPLPQDAH